MAVIQHHTFRLAEGVDEAAFVAADAAYQTCVVYHRPGVIRRTLARGSGGEWLVETWWDTGAHADAEAGDMATNAELSDLIDASTVRVTQYQTVD